MSGATSQELLEQAKGFAVAAGCRDLAWLIEQEIGFQLHPEVRLLFLGPASAGKTTTIDTLLGPAARDVAGMSILPMGVRPTTSQVVEVRTGSARIEGRAVHGTGQVVESSIADTIRGWMADKDSEIRRVMLDVPNAPGVPEHSVLVDTPGIGADEGEFANALVEEALAVSDRYLLCIRARRGIGPAAALLKRVAQLYPYEDGLEDRVLLVLTDTARARGRIEEIVEQAADLLGTKQVDWVELPAPGEVDSIRRQLKDLAREQHDAESLDARAGTVLRYLVLPELRSAVKRHLANQERGAEAEGHLQKFVNKGRELIRKLEAETADAERRMTREAREGLQRQIEAIQSELDSFIDETEHTVWEAYRDQVGRTLELRCKQHVSDLSESLDSEMRDLVERFADYLKEFEQDVCDFEAISAQLPPGELAAVKRAFRRGVQGPGLRGFLGHLGKMGGRGGVTLGTMNFARKYVSKLYRLFGKRAPADLIRSGIPNAVRPLAKLLKFVSKRFWVVQLVMEVGGVTWDALRAKSKMRSTLR